MAEALQKYPCLYEKGDKGYKEGDREENAWKTVEQFLQLKVHCLRKKFIIQII